MVGNEVFSREMLAGYDPEILHGGTVLVVGAGAGGQNLLQNLALSGVGEIRIVDHDHFEEHNRTRSPLYPTDILPAEGGAGKARLVAEKLFLMMRKKQLPTLFTRTIFMILLGRQILIS